MIDSNKFYTIFLAYHIKAEYHLRGIIYKINVLFINEALNPIK
jgi:hypothetical protein